MKKIYFLIISRIVDRNSRPVRRTDWLACACMAFMVSTSMSRYQNDSILSLLIPLRSVGSG